MDDLIWKAAIAQQEEVHFTGYRSDSLTTTTS